MDTTAPTAPASAGVADWVRSNRPVAGGVFVGVGVLLLGLAVWAAVRGEVFSGGPKPEPTPAAETADPDAPPKELPKATAGKLDRGDYIWGMVLAAAAGLAPLGVGVWLLAGPPPPADPAADRTRVRVALLAAGGLSGTVLMLAGMLFFVRWSDGLVKYLDGGGGPKDLAPTAYSLLMLVAGAGALLAAVGPARAEERNNPLLRRLVYGSNLALTALLLLAVLIAANAVAARRVPNKLDVTETSFYTLSPEFESFLAKLDQPVTAYGLLPEEGAVGGEDGRLVDDARRLLVRAQEVGNGQFTARLLGLTMSNAEHARLRAKYPDVELNGYGVLLTAGEDGKRHVFIRAAELRGTTGGPDAKMTFVGEGRLLKDLAFLTENTGKPVVYFTQGSGELAVGDPPADGGPEPPTATARRLKEYLQNNYVDARPLTFDLADPKVPDDATVVVVAQPVSPLGKGAVEAIRKYMTEARGDRKGKLVVLAGTPTPPAGPPAKTGLEALLEEYNVRLGDKYLYSERSDDAPPEVATVMVYPPAAAAGNPVARTFSRFAVGLPGWRETTPLRGRPEVQAVPVLITDPSRATWLEATPPDDPEQTWLDVRRNPAVRREKVAVSGAGRPVAVFASEGKTARLAVFGDSLFVTDAVAGRSGKSVTFELFGGTLDWLRDRPTVAPGVGVKGYTDYRLNPGLDGIRLLWLPLGLAVLAVAAVGAGVWVVRRR